MTSGGGVRAPALPLAASTAARVDARWWSVARRGARGGVLRTRRRVCTAYCCLALFFACGAVIEHEKGNMVSRRLSEPATTDSVPPGHWHSAGPFLLVCFSRQTRRKTPPPATIPPMSGHTAHEEWKAIRFTSKKGNRPRCLLKLCRHPMAVVCFCCCVVVVKRLEWGLPL